MKAVGGGIEAAVHRLGAGAEELREPVLSGVLWETLLHDTAFIQRKEQSVEESGRTVKFMLTHAVETRPPG